MGLVGNKIKKRINMSPLLKAIYYFILVRGNKVKNIDFEAEYFSVWNDFKCLGGYSKGG